MQTRCCSSTDRHPFKALFEITPALGGHLLTTLYTIYTIWVFGRQGDNKISLIEKQYIHFRTKSGYLIIVKLYNVDEVLSCNLST